MTRSYLIKIFIRFRSSKIWRISITWLRSNLPNPTPKLKKGYFNLIRGFSPAILAWFHSCKEFTIYYYTMMSTLLAIPVGSIFKSDAGSRAGISSSYLIMGKLGLCIIRECGFVYMMIRTAGGGVVTILYVSTIEGFFGRGRI